MTDLTPIDRAPAHAAVHCCDLHNQHCEPPADLCCMRCAEASHPDHRRGEVCVLAALPQRTAVTDLTPLNRAPAPRDAAVPQPGDRDMPDQEIIASARGMVLSWIAESALMLRIDQPPDAQGLDAHSRVVDRHIEALLDIRRDLALSWGWLPPPAPFPFPEGRTATRD